MTQLALPCTVAHDGHPSRRPGEWMTDAEIWWWGALDNLCETARMGHPAPHMVCPPTPALLWRQADEMREEWARLWSLR